MMLLCPCDWFIKRERGENANMVNPIKLHTKNVLIEFFNSMAKLVIGFSQFIKE